MRKVLIVSLVCVNVALLAVLLLGYGAPVAKAQVAGGGADYLMVTGQIGQGWDGVYILDLASRRLVAFRFDKTEKALTPFMTRELKRDFPPR